MDSRTPACFVALDMGTTNTRAWLVVEDAIVARARAGVGIRDAAIGRSRAVLAQTVQDLVAELSAGAPGGRVPEKVVAAGMITSAQGLAEVPYVPAPAGVAELAAGVWRHRLPDSSGLDVLLVPGVRTGPPRIAVERVGEVDVMRGEETLYAGLHAANLLRPGEVLLNLGSHWKVVQSDEEGRVAASRTFLTGEMMHAAQTRTVLAASVPDGRPATLDRAWVELGAQEVVRAGLDRALFCVRLLDLRADTTPEQRLAYLVGACTAAAGPQLERVIPADRGVVVAGAGAVASAVTEWLRRVGREVRLLSADEVEAGVVLGLSRIAAAALVPRG